jgi:hypothetical protein
MRYETWCASNISYYAKQKEMTTLYLGTIKRLTAAIRFYERNGFKLVEKKLATFISDYGCGYAFFLPAIFRLVRRRSFPKPCQ